MGLAKLHWIRPTVPSRWTVQRCGMVAVGQLLDLWAGVKAL